MKILISRPCYDTYEYENTVTLEFMKLKTNAAGHECGFHFCKGSNIAELREQAARIAIGSKADYILYVDSDMMVMEDSLIRLLDAKRDIISGVYYGKQPPHNALVARKDKAGDYVPVKHLPIDSVVSDIDAVGFGFVLINIDVLSKIEPPYFKMEKSISEDYYFCRKAKEAGFDICVDTGCQLGHIGKYTYTYADSEVMAGKIITPG